MVPAFPSRSESSTSKMAAVRPKGTIGGRSRSRFYAITRRARPPADGGGRPRLGPDRLLSYSRLGLRAFGLGGGILIKGRTGGGGLGLGGAWRERRGRGLGGGRGSHGQCLGGGQGVSCGRGLRGGRRLVRLRL